MKISTVLQTKTKHCSSEALFQSFKITPRGFTGLRQAVCTELLLEKKMFVGEYESVQD